MATARPTLCEKSNQPVASAAASGGASASATAAVGASGRPWPAPETAASANSHTADPLGVTSSASATKDAAVSVNPVAHGIAGPSRLVRPPPQMPNTTAAAAISSSALEAFTGGKAKTLRSISEVNIIAENMPTQTRKVPALASRNCRLRHSDAANNGCWRTRWLISSTASPTTKTAKYSGASALSAPSGPPVMPPPIVRPNPAAASATTSAEKPSVNATAPTQSNRPAAWRGSSRSERAAHANATTPARPVAQKMARQPNRLAR